MGRYQKFSPALIVSSPALNVPSPALITPLPNILAANVPKKTGTTPSFRSFALLLIVSFIPFISNSDSSSHLTVFIISSIFSFEIINTLVRKVRKTT